MTDESRAPERFSLSRWSRRKLEAARAEAAPPEVAPVPVAAAPAATPAVSATAAPAPSPPEAVLPPVDTLTFDSDFAPFLKPEVDPATQRAALKKLFSDPRFNVMDGLDTYIDDYTKADPMPAGMLERLATVYAKLTEEAKEDEAPLASTKNGPAPAAAPPAPEAAPPALDVAPPALEVAPPALDVAPPAAERVAPAAATAKPPVA